MKETLFNEKLMGREFGSYLLSVEDLLEWTKSKRVHLPIIYGLDSAKFIQVELLLSAIASNLSTLAEGLALKIIDADGRFKSDQHATDFPVFTVAGQASLDWRELITAAIQTEELRLLDFGSKLPIRNAASSNSNPKNMTVKLRWTPEFLEEVATYRDKNGTKATAKHFNVTTAMIRKKLPGVALIKSKNDAFGYR